MYRAGGSVFIEMLRQKQRNAETTFKQRDEKQKKESREMKDRFLTKKLKDSHFLNSDIMTKANSQDRMILTKGQS